MDGKNDRNPIGHIQTASIKRIYRLLSPFLSARLKRRRLGFNALSLDQLQVFSPSFIITGRTCVHRSRGYSSSSSSASSYLLLFFFCFSLKESDGIHHHRYRRRRHRRSLSLSFRSAPVIRSFERQETGASKKRRRRNVESSSPNLISFFLSSCLYIK